MTKAQGYAAHDAKTPLVPFSFERREPRGEDVEIEILYCGICHTDIHQTRDDWHNAMYPMVPGHEIIGRVTRVGAQVKKFKAGDIAGVGVYVDSCRQCGACRADLEQYCEHGGTSWTYNSKARGSDEVNMGGYSDYIVAAERYTVKIPSHMDLKAVAPLLCAGITTYS
ncbi:MAG TPA: alcohol dehydrogenase catalytic domain-containing protein, partial [Rhizomicrobium sp.]